MKSYVLGFMFSMDKKDVVLIQKNRPAWQAGKINGVGGHIEPLETPRAAMAREFYEETGVETNQDHWGCYARMSNENAEVYVYRIFSDKVGTVETKTDETIFVQRVDEPLYDFISNLRWLIPLALDRSTLFSESTF